MTKRFNVLVFPAGTEIGLEIQRALYLCKEVRLFAASLAISNHAPYVFANYFTVPSVHEAGWLDRLNEILFQNQIDYIFPAHDDVIVALAQHQNALHAKVVTSPLETCLLTRSKSKTYRHFADILPVPHHYEQSVSIEKFPVFLKPDRGQGSQGTRIVHTVDDLIHALQERDDLIILEYLPGKEYTVDCFSDRERGLLFCGGRERVRTRSGISMDSHSLYEAIFADYAQKITTHLDLHGAWFFQVKKDAAGVYKLMEIAPRIAGTMALHRVQGVNFPLLSLYEQERIPVSILTNSIDVEIDRALINRYRHSLDYSAVYVDLDDTLILNEAVNTDLIRFLYQCINHHIPIILLTKHRHNLSETLHRFRLQGIFDKVIQLAETANKADYITESDAIFIDDSFSERKTVHEQCGIMTFDCSMIEMLMDERV